MADKQDGPQKEFRPKGYSAKKTEKGPHGGGNSYLSGGKVVSPKFVVAQPIPGHTQKTNIKK